MSVKIERQVAVVAECDCGKLHRASYANRKECLAALKRAGWQIKIHRKGEPTVVCPQCVDSAAADKEQREAAAAALKKSKDDALAKYKEGMKELKGGSVQEEEAEDGKAHQDA